MVVEQLLGPALESERRTVCVLFLDIRGLTAMTRTRAAAETVTLLNDFFAEIGRPDDFAAIAPFLHDERARVVVEAVRALAGIHASGGLDAFVDVLHDKLRSSSTRVACEAAHALALLPPDLVDVKLGRDLLDRAPPRKLRGALLAIDGLPRA